MSKLINIIFIAVILISLSISGNYNHHDINDLAYVVGIGIDVRGK